jgi:hypothetical protein
VGKYDVQYRFSQDIDLFLRLAEIGKLVNLPDVLLDYRQHHNSIGYSHSGEQNAYVKRAVLLAKSRRGIGFESDTFEFNAEPQSIADSHRKWAWWSLMAGNITTSRKHALKALRKEPFNIENLKLAACALRGY